MRFPDIERRRRLVRRHNLSRTAADALQAVRGVAAFHSTDPVTPYLGMWARIPSFRIGHLDHLLWDDRSLWRLHAMRRTLFLVPTETASTFLSGASLDIARKERLRLEGWLESEMPSESIGPWLESLTRRAMEVLEGGEEWRTQEIAAAIPELDRKIKTGAGKWTLQVRVSSRLLYVLGMEGRIVRTRPAGSWRSSQYRWAAATRWWEEPPTPTEDEATARADLTRLYLATHGPVSLADLRWWTGWTAKHSRAALEEVGAMTVELDSGTDGYVLADDLDQEPGLPPASVALLPGLDPTPMGWKERGWYLGPHTDLLFDRNGNVGPTVWVEGRIVGGWGQQADGTVVYELLEEVNGDAVDRLDEEAESLTSWLDGQVVSIRFKTPLQRKLAGGNG